MKPGFLVSTQIGKSIHAGPTFSAHQHRIDDGAYAFGLLEKARAYVENGGSIYASLSADAAIPEMQALFGASLVDHLPTRDVTLKIVAPFGDLKPGETFSFSANAEDVGQWGVRLAVEGGQVIAVDQEGRPALVAHALGRGKTLLLRISIEIYLANQPLAFESGEQTFRIYKALQAWSGFKTAGIDRHTFRRGRGSQRQQSRIHCGGESFSPTSTRFAQHLLTDQIPEPSHGGWRADNLPPGIWLDAGSAALRRRPAQWR